jgi:transcriptional regulator with XRE-family HTH domain
MEKPTSPIAQYRKANGETMKSLGEKLGVDKTTILRWESGSHPVPTKRLLDLEKATGIPRWVLRPDIFGTGASL